MPQGWEWILIVLVVLLLFGGAKIPQLMRGLGRGVSEFQSGIQEGKQKVKQALSETSTTATDDTTGTK